MEEKDVIKLDKKIVFLIWGIVLIFIVFLFFKMNKSGLAEGDYSNHTCHYCENPANGGAYFIGGKADNYYCKEHFERTTSIQGNLSNQSDNVECQVCNREFQAGSENAKSIRKTNMCSQCYKNYKGASGAMKELPQD
ncbi:MAG: hypothetical protein J6J24_05560 [Clostridia bacterium]|nr:hypothetical protein [Clostridia bacterium]